MKKLILMTIVATQTLLALVSIQPVEIGVQPGITGKVEAGFETKRGNTDKDNYKASLRVVYDSNKDYVTWAELSGEYGESNKVEDTNKAYIHLRYIHALTKDNLRGELFFQSQENKFKNIKRRRLGGAGVRYKLFSFFEKDNSYLGLGAFYESILYTTALDEDENTYRLNSYFAYTTPFGDDSTFTYTLYYQPSFDKFNDYIVTNSLELKLHIYKELFLKFNIKYDKDTKPPLGVEDYDFTQTTSFVYNF